jgi:hypothetical protein
MKSKIALFALSIGILATGCATRESLFSVPVISMTENSMAANSSAKAIGPVTSQYCRGQDAITGQGETVGFVDEVVMRAQKEKDAKYIREAQVFRKGDCYLLEGTAAK